MPSRSAVGWALLLSVPPGVGVTGYATMVVRRGGLEPQAVAAGVIVWAAIFALVLGSQLTGAAEVPAIRERME